MDIDAAVSQLEARIRRRGKWRGRPVFYQVLEGELAPILAAAADPGNVRRRVNEILKRHGHAIEGPPLPAGASGPTHFPQIMATIPDRNAKS